MNTNYRRDPSVKYIHTPKGYIIVDERTKPEPTMFQQLFKTPKRSLIVLLLALGLIGSLNSSFFVGWFHVFLAVLTATLVEGIGLSVTAKKVKKQLPDGAILTGLIVGLVLSSFTPWYVVIVASAVSVASKYVVRFRKKPIFNPAALGLLISVAIFSSGQSWWGALTLMPDWFAPLLIIAGYFITKKVNKFPLVFAFLGSYFIILVAAALLGIGDVTDALRNPFLNSALFLAFFMMTDPPTSPAKYKDQLSFGFIVGVISAVYYLVFGGLIFLLIGLLVANAWKAWKIKKTSKTPHAQSKNTRIERRHA